MRPEDKTLAEMHENLNHVKEVAQAIWERRRQFFREEYGQDGLEEWGDGTLPTVNGVMGEAVTAIKAVQAIINRNSHSPG